MKKSDLKQNMIVETRHGDRYLVLENVDTSVHGHQDLLFINSDGYETGENYYEDLNIKGKNVDVGMLNFDVMKVMKWKKFRGLECLKKAKSYEFEVLWERPVTIDWQPWELEVLKHIPSDLGGIGIDSHGKAYLMKNEAEYGYPLKLNLPSLQAYSNKEFSMLNIDKELERYNMKREKRGENENEKI